MNLHAQADTVRRSTPRLGRRPRNAPARSLTRAEVRALRAVALIIGAMTALAVANLITTDHASTPAFEGRSLSGAMLDSIRNGSEVLAEDETLPPWFEEEFFPTADYFSFHCNAEQTVMSCTSPWPAAATLDAITAAMEAKGWTAIAAGEPSIMTMVRTEGSHTWALLWSQELGGQCTIVVQTLPCQ